MSIYKLHTANPCVQIPYVLLLKYSDAHWLKPINSDTPCGRLAVRKKHPKQASRSCTAGCVVLHTKLRICSNLKLKSIENV